MSNGLELIAEGLEQLKGELENQALINVLPWNEIYLKLNDGLDILNSATSAVDNYVPVVKHPVDQMGLGDITLALYEEGTSFKDISEYHKHRTFDISPKQVQQWIESYSNKTVLAKVDLEHGSVFDTQIQIQGLFDNLSTMLKKIELKNNSDYAIARTSKDEVYLAYCTEVRQVIKDAAALTEAVANMQNIEEFQRIVLQVVNEVDPKVKNRIMRKWKKQKELSKGFI